MTISLFYLERGAVLIGSVQLVLLEKAKKRKRNEMSWHQRLNAVQHLQDCKHDEENPFSQGFIEIYLLPRKENIRLIYTLGKLNNWVLPISLMKETFPNTKFSRGS